MLHQQEPLMELQQTIDELPLDKTQHPVQLNSQELPVIGQNTFRGDNQ
jgi:hypothetical protein